ncbi:MAG: PAS domain S-box protein, partial [Chloroflexi bacterium]
MHESIYMASNASPNGSPLPVYFRDLPPNNESADHASHPASSEHDVLHYPAGMLETVLHQPELLKALLDQLPHGLIVCDLHEQVQMANTAALNLLSFQPEAPLPIGLSAVEDRLRSANGEENRFEKGCFRRALSGEAISNQAALIARPDGTSSSVLVSSGPLYNLAGNIAGVVVSLVDITTYKHDDEFRAYAAAILEHADEPIIGRTLEGTIVTWNAGAERVYGYNAAEAIGQPITMLFLPDNQDEHRLMIERLRQGERLLSMETKRRRKDGSILDISLTVSPIRTEQGTLIGVSAISHDVTSRKRIEHVLRTSEQRFRELADSMPQLVWTALPDGTVDYYNRRYQEYQGIAPTADQGWQWAPVLHPDDMQRTVDAWQHAVETGETYQIEHRVYRADGSLRWVLSRGVPVRDDEGRVIRWYGTATDIHDQKMAEDALRRANEQIGAILASINDGFFTLDNEWRFAYFNDAAETILNLKAEDVLGRHFLEIFPAAKGTIFEERYTWVMEHHKPTAFEAYFETVPFANWYDVRVYPRKHGISIYFQVITERKRAEATIQAQARLLDQMHDAILVWDRDGRIVQWYRGAERLYGWSAEEASGKVSLKLLKSKAGIPWKTVEANLQRNGRWSGEITHRTKDGREIIVESQMTLVYGAEDQQLVLEINRDVTERKWVEQIIAQSHAEVLEQRRRLKTVLAALPVGVVIADREGRLLEANEEATRIWGGVPMVLSVSEYREY